MTKTCSQCKREKSTSEYSPNGARLRAACKVCEASNKRQERKENGEHVRTIERNYMQRNPTARDRRAAKSKEWWDKKRADGTASDLYKKHNYGLTPEQIVQLKQLDPVCAICKRSTTLHTDHCRTTNVVRGRLCVRCNTALGKFGDTTVLLHKAIAYLEARSKGALESVPAEQSPHRHSRSNDLGR